MSSFDDHEILTTFDALREQYIPNVIDKLSQCQLAQSCVYRYTMPESNTDIAHVGVTEVNEALISELGKMLRPHYRSDREPFPPRLVGTLRFTGTPSQTNAAILAIEELNAQKDNLKRYLAECFPQMHKRTTFIRNHFKSMTMRSVYRHLPLAPLPVKSVTMTWADKNQRGRFIEAVDIGTILKQHPNLDVIERVEMEARANTIMSHSERYQLVQFVPVRVHVKQSVFLKHNDKSERKTLRPGLPLIAFGDDPIRLKPLGDYHVGARKPTMQREQHRHHYEPILPSIGLYQRRKTDAEWLAEQSIKES